MAKGIDSYAHTAALKTQGYTIAVLGNGVDIGYPMEHDRLYEEIARLGCVLSEYPPGTAPREYNFPRRNRIIAALSDTLYVVDAGRHSGTESTIENSRKYGREVVIV
jgi:DNA processing protein